MLLYIRNTILLTSFFIFFLYNNKNILHIYYRYIYSIIEIVLMFLCSVYSFLVYSHSKHFYSNQIKCLLLYCSSVLVSVCLKFVVWTPKSWFCDKILRKWGQFITFIFYINLVQFLFFYFALVRGWLPP